VLEKEGVNARRVPSFVRLTSCLACFSLYFDGEDNDNLWKMS